MGNVMATELDPAGAELRAIHEIALFRDARVLEIGAGEGRLTFRYAKEAKWVVGIDAKEGEIRSATRNCPADVLAHVRFLCASVTALPFPAQKFEIVLFASSL
jgi:ubiquinone/menaquinone biosynthesis C-methylase UbiE